MTGKIEARAERIQYNGNLIAPFPLMRWLLAFMLILPGFRALGASTCEDVFRKIPASSEESRDAKLVALNGRLEKLFGESWKRDWVYYQPDFAHDFNTPGAQITFRRLMESGSDLDLEIFETYLSIKELTLGHYDIAERAEDYYSDSLSEQRPKSNVFQERHWEWGNLGGYFHNRAIPFSENKTRDLAYLQEVKQTAQRSRSKRPLRDILKEVNLRRDLRALSGSPALLSEFRTYIRNLRLKTEDGVSSRQGEWALAVLENSDSDLDRFIYDLYISKKDLFAGTTSNARIPEQMSSWKVFDGSLAKGSPESVVDFLFQNSHDTQLKLVFAKTLFAMKKSDGSFENAFRAAFKNVSAAMPTIPRPQGFDTDVHMFSVASYSAPPLPGDRHRTLEAPTINETVLVWNEKLGRIEAQTQTKGVISEGADVQVKHLPALERYLKDYLGYLERAGGFSATQLQKDFLREMGSSLTRSTFIVFTKPGADEMVAMIRIYDGSKLEMFRYGTQNPMTGRAQNDPVYIERQFTNLLLPSRASDEDVREVGRLFAKKTARANSFVSIMTRVADFLENTNARGSVYLDALKPAKDYYVRHGADIVYTPEQLPLGENDARVWILHVTVKKLVNLFRRASFETVRLRQPNIDQ